MENSDGVVWIPVTIWLFPYACSTISPHPARSFGFGWHTGSYPALTAHVNESKKLDQRFGRFLGPFFQNPVTGIWQDAIRAIHDQPFLRFSPLIQERGR